MNARKRQQDTTRKAILDALGEAVVETGALEFSIQDVANRAGVSHRTVYNHFPTRAALNDAFAHHTEALLAELYPGDRPPDEDATLDTMPQITAGSYRVFSQVEGPTRAYVMLMIASRSAAQLTRERTKRFERKVGQELGPLPKATSRQVTAALRMFVSTTGWHVLTEQLELSTEEAAGVAAWAVETLVDQVRKGNVPKRRGKS